MEGLRVRRASGDDAERMNTYIARLVDEPHNNVVRDPGEWTKTVEEEREILERAAAAENELFVVAELEGRIVGVANIRRGAGSTNRHRASLGVSVDQDFRRRGIGMMLMRALIDWSKQPGVRRVELQVFARNGGAIALYEKLGFVKEGLHKMAFLKQGVWVDEYTMALILPGEATGDKRATDEHK
jgi:RimJ/RimL family protein N-acetyltransferase